MASSVSAIFGLRMPSPAAAAAVEKPKVEWIGVTTVECSSRPQKKGTKHHMKTRPKKTQAWDIKRKPTVYPKLMDLPREWTLVEAAEVVPVAEESVETAV